MMGATYSDVAVPGDLLADKRLSLQAKMFWITLRSVIAGQRFAMLSQVTLAAEMDVDPRTIKRWVAQLRDCGWLETKRGKNPDGTKGKNFYRLRVVSQWFQFGDSGESGDSGNESAHVPETIDSLSTVTTGQKCHHVRDTGVPTFGTPVSPQVMISNDPVEEPPFPPLQRQGGHVSSPSKSFRWILRPAKNRIERRACDAVRQHVGKACDMCGRQLLPVDAGAVLLDKASGEVVPAIAMVGGGMVDGEWRKAQPGHVRCALNLQHARIFDARAG